MLSVLSVAYTSEEVSGVSCYPNHDPCHPNGHFMSTALKYDRNVWGAGHQFEERCGMYRKSNVG